MNRQVFCRPLLLALKKKSAVGKHPEYEAASVVRAAPLWHATCLARASNSTPLFPFCPAAKMSLQIPCPLCLVSTCPAAGLSLLCQVSRTSAAGQFTRRQEAKYIYLALNSDAFTNGDEPCHLPPDATTLKAGEARHAINKSCFPPQKKSPRDLRQGTALTQTKRIRVRKPPQLAPWVKRLDERKVERQADRQKERQTVLVSHPSFTF